jgi:hypothetical protein
MSTTLPCVADLTDCPECHSTGSVERGLCQVCYAETDELQEAAGLPPAAPLEEITRRF